MNFSTIASDKNLTSFLMVDRYTKVAKQGFLSRLWGSVVGVLIGILVFFASFYVLFTNEGRVDLSEVAVDAVELNAEEVSADLDGEFVYLTSTLVSEETLGDNLYLIPGDYLAVSRTVEMNAWIEETETTREENLGGSETTTTTYEYKNGWTENVPESSNFDTPEGHYNPDKAIDSGSFRVGSAKMGVYELDMDGLSLPGMEDLNLNEEMLNVELSGAAEDDVSDFFYF